MRPVGNNILWVADMGNQMYHVKVLQKSRSKYSDKFDLRLVNLQARIFEKALDGCPLPTLAKSNTISPAVTPIFNSLNWVVIKSAGGYTFI